MDKHIYKLPLWWEHDFLVHKEYHWNLHDSLKLYGDCPWCRERGVKL